MRVGFPKRKDRWTGRQDKYSLFVIAVLSTFLFLPFFLHCIDLDVLIFFYVFVLDSILLNRNVHKFIHNMLLIG